MASRREQKDQLRREREEREAAVKAEQRRRQLIGYGAGGLVVLVAVAIGIVLLSGGSGGGSASADVLPDGGSVPEFRDDVDLPAAAKAAGCELKSYRATSREHVADLSVKIKYASKPPTSGNHYQEWAEDGAYEDPPDVKELVHASEHGRITIWFKKSLPSEDRAALKKYFDEDSYQMLLVPDETGMKYQVAATAWNRDPEPNGTGRLLGCPRYDDEIYTAFEAFKDEHRSRGPEPVP
jgi:Protein of unknown function (DUF3105)